MRRHIVIALPLILSAAVAAEPGAKSRPLDVHPRHVSQDVSVRYDYDIVYVRAPRKGDDKEILWAEVVNPTRSESGSDLMLLHPDGSEEVLVAAGTDAIADPYVSFDGQWVYFARFHYVQRPGMPGLTSESSDIFKIHVKSRKVVRLTRQVFTPNTGVAVGGQRPAGVFNLGPCPLPGGRVMFTSNRNGLAPTKLYTPTVMQLFVMDDDGGNQEQVGYLNVNSALHPAILKDGRVLFSTYESQGLRDLRLWGLWTIHPDGAHWAPLASALGPLGATALHFQTQLSSEEVVFEEYYNLNNQGFGTFYKCPAHAPDGQPPFGPGAYRNPRNLPFEGAQGLRISYTPYGLEWLTPFCSTNDAPARLSDPANPASPRVGKVTHPCGAPDGHLLLVWSPGPVNSNNGLRKPSIDSGIYLMKYGQPVREPGQLLLIKNDPRYNEQWPRPVVPYSRIFGVPEPKYLPPVANDGKASPHLPEGTPYGLIGTSSLYKLESYPRGDVPPDKVRATYAGGGDPFQGLGSLASPDFAGNWHAQGADACRYEDSEIHAVRILATEPTTDPRYTAAGQRLWWNIANERLRILGEIPVRKLQGGRQPTDPDGNSDTSFLARIPADVAFTFQTLDRNGMVLNMAQTWHQLRPGEVRNDCGGCHAHSQKPTRFEDTAAARPDYIPFDLTRAAPLLTARAHDQSGRQWDTDGETGLRFEKGPKNVEYFRDVQPIFQRSCVACHTRSWERPAGNLVLDDETPMQRVQGLAGFAGSPPGKVPGTFFRLAVDPDAQFGHKPPVRQWLYPQASRYVRFFQSRRSLLIWKVYGKRLDGWSNDDFVTEAVPGDPTSLRYKGQPLASKAGHERQINLAYTGSIMPPPEAVAGTYRGPDGNKVRVSPLSDEDRRTLVRWIDLGCPIDLDYNPAQPQARGRGWLQDDTRPTLTLTYPRRGPNPELTRIVVGMHDYDSGLDLDSFQVTADFALDGVPAGESLAGKFKPKARGVWEYKLATPVISLAKGNLAVSVRDRQGNVSFIERSFSVARGQ
jgi:hypothetical protein